MFGVVLGTLWSQVAMTLAILAPFLYSRHLGRELVARRMGRRLQRFDDLLGQHGFMVVLLIRLCPVGNNFLTNYLAGVTAIPLGTFLAASFVGYLPESFIFALLGSGFADHPQLRLWGGAILLAAFSLFFIWYFRRSKEGAKIPPPCARNREIEERRCIAQPRRRAARRLQPFQNAVRQGN